MDVVSGGAGVVAFVTIAAQSAKIIFDVLAGIKDGPTNIMQAARTVAMLQQTLAQLADCQAVNKANPGQDIKSHIKSCSDDLTAFASKLSRLQSLDSDSQSRKVWKRFKTVLNIKDVDTMTRVIGAHSSTLGLWLVSSQANPIHSSADIVSALSRNVLVGHQVNSIQWNTAQTKLDGINRDIMDLGIRGNEQSSAMQTTLKQIESNFNTTQTGTNDHLLRIASAMDESGARSRNEHQTIQSMCSLILNVVNSLQNTETARDQKICTLLQRLQEEAGETRRQDPEHGDPRHNTTQAGIAIPHDRSEENIFRDDKVSKSINRLCNLANCQGQTVTVEDAEETIDDLQTVLRAAQELSKELTEVQSLKRAWGLLSVTQNLSINEGEKLRRPLVNLVARNQLVRKAYDMENGILTVSNKRRRLKCHVLDSDSVAHGRDAENVDEHIVKLTFFPHSRTGGMFNATIKLEDRWNGTFSFIPRLEANRVLPRDSLVFQLVSEGQLEAFQRLLHKGKASLRDHDEFGNSLIALAAKHFQPQLCRFLLSHHADVDGYRFISSDFNERAPISKPAGPPSETTPEVRERILECQGLLLDAGGDPTDFTDYGGSAIELAFADGVIESMRQLLDWSEHFDLIGSRDGYGDTPLLSACRNSGLGYSKSIFSLLFERGANILDLDFQGQSCLHLCLTCAGQSELRAEQEQEALIYLVKNGAKVQANDVVGRSVSHIVYSRYRQDACLGSYRRDLWDSVLTICGYNILEIRGDFRRIGRYRRVKQKWSIREYTRDHFRRLWNGWEDICPYPEDLGDEGAEDDLDGTESFENSSFGDNRSEDGSCTDDNSEDNRSEDGGCTDDNSDDVSSEDDSPEDNEYGGYGLCADCLGYYSCRDPNCDFCTAPESDSDDSWVTVE